jgi:hypothetical protein
MAGSGPDSRATLIRGIEGLGLLFIAGIFIAARACMNRMDHEMVRKHTRISTRDYRRI